MTTKNIIVGALWIIGAVLFALVGFTVEDGAPDFNLVALGLFCWLVGVFLDRFWAAT